MQYVELHCKSNFSFLTGASHPDELVERASELGYRGLALTDESSIAGVVRGSRSREGLGPAIHCWNRGSSDRCSIHGVMAN